MTNTIPSTTPKLWKLDKNTNTWKIQMICYENAEDYLLVYQSLYTKDAFKVSCTKPN
jgi:hypothetical protein